VSILNVYAPTEDKEDSVKDNFYERLEREYNAIPSNDIKIIVGDLNAKVSQEEIYKGTTGLNSLHTSCNDNGRCLIDFAQSRNLLAQPSSLIKTFISKPGCHQMGRLLTK
jgi:hypothetical protein